MFVPARVCRWTVFECEGDVEERVVRWLYMLWWNGAATFLFMRANCVLGAAKVHCFDSLGCLWVVLAG